MKTKQREKIYLCVCCVWFAPCVCGAHRGQKKASEPLGLELQVFVSHLIWKLGTKFRSSWWTTWVLNCCAIKTLAPLSFFKINLFFILNLIFPLGSLAALVSEMSSVDRRKPHRIMQSTAFYKDSQILFWGKLYGNNAKPNYFGNREIIFYLKGAVLWLHQPAGRKLDLLKHCFSSIVSTGSLKIIP